MFEDKGECLDDLGRLFVYGLVCIVIGLSLIAAIVWLVWRG